MGRVSTLLMWLVALTGLASLCTVGACACHRPAIARRRAAGAAHSERRLTTAVRASGARAIGFGACLGIALIRHPLRGPPGPIPPPGAGAASAESRVVEEALAQKRLVIFSKTYSPYVHMPLAGPLAGSH